MLKSPHLKSSYFLKTISGIKNHFLLKELEEIQWVSLDLLELYKCLKEDSRI